MPMALTASRMERLASDESSIMEPLQSRPVLCRAVIGLLRFQSWRIAPEGFWYLAKLRPRKWVTLPKLSLSKCWTSSWRPRGFLLPSVLIVALHLARRPYCCCLRARCKSLPIAIASSRVSASASYRQISLAALGVTELPPCSRNMRH